MPETVMTTVQTILLALVGLFFLWKLVTHLCTWTYFARYDQRYAPAGHEPKVSIVKPVKGLDQAALENFRSFCEQEYGNEYEILFCADEPSDPGVPIIQQTMAEYGHVNIRLVFSDPQQSQAIGKIRKTIVGLASSAHDVVIFSDSDARAPRMFLKESVAFLDDRAVGLGFSAPAYEGCQDWGAALMAVSVNELVLNMATPSLFGLFDGAVGTTMVMRKEVLAEIGGLERLGRHIVDDIPLSRAVREKGYKVHLQKQPARVVHQRDTFGHWWDHWRRWQTIIRQYWPVKSFVMNVLDLALWWAFFYLLLALVGRGSLGGALLLLLAVVAVSLLSAAIVNVKFVHEKRLWPFLWTVLVRDVCRLPLLVQSYCTREFVWRGERFRVARGGVATVLESSGDSLIQQY